MLHLRYRACRSGRTIIRAVQILVRIITSEIVVWAKSGVLYVARFVGKVSAVAGDCIGYCERNSAVVGDCIGYCERNGVHMNMYLVLNRRFEYPDLILTVSVCGAGLRPGFGTSSVYTREEMLAAIVAAAARINRHEDELALTTRDLPTRVS